MTSDETQGDRKLTNAAVAALFHEIADVLEKARS